MNPAIRKYLLISFDRQIIRYTGPTHQSVATHWAGQHPHLATYVKVIDRETNECEYFYLDMGEVTAVEEDHGIRDLFQQ